MNKGKQGRIHGSPCIGRLSRGSYELGRGSNELGRGSIELGRGSDDLDRGSKVRPNDQLTETVPFRSRCPRRKPNLVIVYLSYWM